MTTLCWINGQWHPADQPLISPLDRAYLYGDGVFETLRSYRGRFFRVNRHLARMYRGLDLLGIRPGPEVDRAVSAFGDLFGLLGTYDVIARITVTRGSGWQEPATSDTAIVTALAKRVPIDPPPPVRAVLSSIMRDSTSPMCEIKTCNWLPGILAQREARALGYNEAILMNHSGSLAEATSSNLFWVTGSELFTPAVECGALPGIAREAVIEVAEAAGIPVNEGAFPPESLLAADGMFLTNSGQGIRTVSTYGERRYSDPAPDGIVAVLLEGLERLIAAESQPEGLWVR